MNRPRKSTPEQEQLLYREEAEADDVVLAIDLVVTDQLFGHESQIRKLIDHDNEEIRAQAARSLIAIWAREDLFAKGYDMMLNDRSEFVRSEVATGFGVWLRHGGANSPRRQEVLYEMVSALRKEKDELALMGIYGDLVSALTGDDFLVPEDFDAAQDIDWKLIASHLPDMN